jgi:hypothetical protein
MSFYPLTLLAADVSEALHGGLPECRVRRSTDGAHWNGHAFQIEGKTLPRHIITFNDGAAHQLDEALSEQHADPRSGLRGCG